MGRPWIAVVVLSASCVTLQALAAHPHRHPLSARRQLADCMTRQMSASRTITYNQATAVCKAQLGAQRSTLAASVPKPAGDRGQ